MKALEIIEKLEERFDKMDLMNFTYDSSLMYHIFGEVRFEECVAYDHNELIYVYHFKNHDVYIGLNVFISSYEGKQPEDYEQVFKKVTVVWQKKSDIEEETTTFNTDNSLEDDSLNY